MIQINTELEQQKDGSETARIAGAWPRWTNGEQGDRHHHGQGSSTPPTRAPFM